MFFLLFAGVRRRHTFSRRPANRNYYRFDIVDQLDGKCRCRTLINFNEKVMYIDGVNGHGAMEKNVFNSLIEKSEKKKSSFTMTMTRIEGVRPFDLRRHHYSLSVHMMLMTTEMNESNATTRKTVDKCSMSSSVHSIFFSRVYGN